MTGLCDIIWLCYVLEFRSRKLHEDDIRLHGQIERETHMICRYIHTIFRLLGFGTASDDESLLGSPIKSI